MLRNTEIIDKTFDERIEEGISKIPVYSREWTNHNASDPGITILDNLSLFTTLQQEHVNEIPPEVTKALLKMNGFEAVRGRCAKVLLSSIGLSEKTIIPKGCRFKVGDVFFESTKRQEVQDDCIIGVCGNRKDEFFDYSDILDKDLRLPAHIFGDAPAAGMSVNFIFKELPKENEEIIIYLGCHEEPRRTSFLDKDKSIFNTIRWEVFCADGFKEVNFKDSTGGFVTSGELRIRMPDNKPAIYTEAHESIDIIPEGYCMRAVLESADYDVPPAIITAATGLFEVVQMDTKAYLTSDNKASYIEVHKRFLENRNVRVYVREEKNGSYRQYDEALYENITGRYFEIKKSKDDMLKISFDKNKFGFGPEKGRYAVRVLGYTDEIANSYRIGTVIGYDHETFEVPGTNIVADNFSILAKRYDQDGEPYFDFVRPGHNGDGELSYFLNEREGKIVIEFAGDFIGAELFVGSMSEYSGDKGNIRAGVILQAVNIFEGIRFKNPGRGWGGRFPETLRSLRNRYKADIDTPFAAVTAGDYETLVATTPGLCISKVKAVMEKARNQVYVAVLPAISGKHKYPKLSNDYRERITERLEERRLLTDRISVSDPEYIKVNAKAVVYVTNNTPENYAAVKEKIENCLNYIENDANFGDVLKFDRVFGAIEELAFVDYVYSLVLRPDSLQFASMEDIDIKPVNSGLFVPGNIKIELVTNHK